MQCFSFEVVVNEEITLELTDALFEAGCDDGGVGASRGIWSVHFDREAESLTDAINSATQQIRSVGLSVKRVSLEESDLESLQQSV